MLFYCDYYPTSEGLCWIHCESQAKREQVQQEKEARDIVEREATRMLAEQRKKAFDHMVANSSRKPGILFADVLKKN